MQKIIFDLDIYSYQIDFMGHVNNAVSARAISRGG